MNNLEVNDEIKLMLLNSNFSTSLYKLVNENKDYLSKWLDWVKYVKSEKDTKEFINKCILETQKKTSLTYGIFYVDTLCGLISFSSIEKSNNCATVGYWIAKDFQKKGIITNSLKTLINYGIDTYKLNKIVIQVALGNTPSESIPKKLGFFLEGILKEHQILNGKYTDYKIFSMLKSQWNYKIF